MQTFLGILSFTASSGKNVKISLFRYNWHGWTYDLAQKTALSTTRVVQLCGTKLLWWTHLATQQYHVQRQQTRHVVSR